MANQEEFVNEAKKIVLSHLANLPYFVFLFGSRARQSHGSRADIDIGVWGVERLSPDIRHAIRNDIDDSDIPLKIDIIDFFNADEAFITQALQDTKLWNRPANTPKSSPLLQKLLNH